VTSAATTTKSLVLRADALARGSAPARAATPARRAPEDLARTMPAARMMTVALEPAEALERILGLGLDGLEPRSVAYDRPLMHVYHDGKVFYERTNEGVVLWRRPAHRWFRGALERVPYPDVLDVRIEPIPRGSRIEMRWRAHPITRVATRWNMGWMGLLWVATLASVAVLGPSTGALLLCLSMLIVSVQVSLQLARVRRVLRPMLPRAYAALAPYELGAADATGSAFRVPSVLGIAAPAGARLDDGNG
jgi:hypothetical protein